MSGPLTGIRIVEIASMAPGPFGCMLLADLGAEVLRVDRLSAPALSGPPGPLDRGKRSVAVDVRTPGGAAAVAALAASADVFVEGFRPGVAEELGIGPDLLLRANPRLVYARMTGWGQTGPLASRAGHDINFVAVAGALEPLGPAGGRPIPAVNLLGDFAGGGTFLALGVLAALVERGSSGRGQIIDAAMVDGASVLLSFLHGMRAAGLWDGERGTNLLDGGAPFYDTYETKDGGYVAVGAIEPRFYAELLARLDIPAGSLGAQSDPASWPGIRAALTCAFSHRTRDEWAEEFMDSDACVSPVLSPWEAHTHPHNRARDSFVQVGGLRQPAPAPRFERTSADPPAPLDAGGRDIRATLADWGLSTQQISALIADGVVG